MWMAWAPQQSATTWPQIVALAVLAAVVVAYFVHKRLTRPRPLMLREFEELSTDAELPGNANSSGVQIRVGMIPGDAGATVAAVTSAEKLVRFHSVDQIDDMSPERKRGAIGLVLLFNSDAEIRYPRQRVMLKGKSWEGEVVEKTIDVPAMAGKDGENAYFYVEENGRLYWATKNRWMAASPDLDWHDAFREIRVDA